MCIAVPENSTNCDQEWPHLHLLCTFLYHESVTNKTETVALHDSQSQDISNSEDNLTENITFHCSTATSHIHDSPVCLKIKLNIAMFNGNSSENVTRNDHCQTHVSLQPNDDDDGQESYTVTLAVNTSFSDRCIHDGHNGSEIGQSPNSLWTCTSNPTSQIEDSTCIAPTVLYGITGTLLFIIALLLVVIAVLCAVSLSHRKRNGSAYKGK